MVKIAQKENFVQFLYKLQPYIVVLCKHWKKKKKKIICIYIYVWERERLINKVIQEEEFNEKISQYYNVSVLINHHQD